MTRASLQSKFVYTLKSRVEKTYVLSIGKYCISDQETHFPFEGRGLTLSYS